MLVKVDVIKIVLRMSNSEIDLKLNRIINKDICSFLNVCNQIKSLEVFWGLIIYRKL
jgi:hypothetical protein